MDSLGRERPGEERREMRSLAWGSATWRESWELRRTSRECKWRELKDWCRRESLRSDHAWMISPADEGEGFLAGALTPLLVLSHSSRKMMFGCFAINGGPSSEKDQKSKNWGSTE